MIINTQTLDAAYTGFKTLFNQGFEGAKSITPEITTKVPSSMEKEVYGWLGQFPGMRKWVGDRIIKNLVAHGFTVVNELFEDTISIPRTKIEDDSYGVFSSFFVEMGRAAAEKPDEIVANLLLNGFDQQCFDGQYFFDSDHPVRTGDNDYVSVSNVQSGSSAPWFLLDTSRAIKPILWQERIPFSQFQRLDRDSDHNVFFQDEYIYGVRGRGNAGYGLWQMAFGSKATLDADNYEAARVAMMGFKGDEGRPLGIMPNTLVVPPSLEKKALNILNAEHLENGESNVYRNTAKLIVTPWLSA
ncbi:MAG: Mu-like prophage major head subunit gpT family protein [Nitratireductor sp.]|nr:Mu-like prophage major head subunit gpT family protein [Nitratireductor sp.]